MQAFYGLVRLFHSRWGINTLQKPLFGDSLDLRGQLLPFGNILGVNQMAAIGEFVRKRRKLAALTQKELAELAGVGTRFISDLERGKQTIRLSELDQVLAVFGKSIGVIDRPRTTMIESTE